MEKTLVTFHNCQGLGLQGLKSLVRIPSEFYQINMMSQTLYIVNDNGDYLCTIIKNRDDYESNNNQDRRILNRKNGFRIIWDEDPNKCNIYNDNVNSKKRINKQSVLLIGCFVISLCLGLLGGYLIWENSSLITSQQSQITILSTENEELKRKNETLNIIIDPYRQQIHADSVKSSSIEMKNSLHSMQCNAKTVSNVREWWNNLSKQDQELASHAYDFKFALTKYNQLFNSTDIFDIYRLCRNNVDIFSREQMRVLRMIDKRRFEGIKNIQLRGMNFREIEMELEKQFKYNSKP